MTTVAQILSQDLGSIALAVSGAAAHTDGVLQLPPLSRQAVLGQVETSLNALHEITVGGALGLAWQVSRTLNQAGQDSLRTRQPQTAQFQGFAIPIEYEPQLQVLVNQQPVASVALTLRLTLELFHFTGVVRLGRLVEVSSDTFNVTVELFAAGRRLAHRTTHLNLALEMPLPTGGIPVARNTQA